MGIESSSSQIDDEAGFLTIDEVLVYLKVKSRTIYRLINIGSLPAVRVGRQWRIRRRDLDAWLDSQRVGGPTDV
jgi:excisionase family DNA binding protein